MMDDEEQWFSFFKSLEIFAYFPSSSFLPEKVQVAQYDTLHLLI